MRKFEDLLAASSTDEQQRVAKRLRTLLSKIGTGDGAQGDKNKKQHARDRIEAATSAEEIFQMLDVELGDA
ncbi:hypothetical protein NKH77_43970 [Streptomyces sp. M19]